MTKRIAFITVGLPGSGKTTWRDNMTSALDQLGIEWAALERDELRDEMFGIFASIEDVRAYYTSHNLCKKEAAVTEEFRRRTSAMLESDARVLFFTDTWLRQRDLKKHIQWMETNEVQPVIISFLHDCNGSRVGPRVAKERNRQREGTPRMVGEDIIDRMHLRVAGVAQFIERSGLPWFAPDCDAPVVIIEEYLRKE